MATHSSILAWRISWTDEPGRLQSMGSQRVRHDWATSLSLSNYLILSVIPFSSCPQSFPASGSFPMSQLFATGGQGIGASASVSVLPMSIQGWYPSGLTGFIFLQSKGLSRVFSSTTIWKHQFFGTQPSLWSNSHICTLLLGKKLIFHYTMLVFFFFFLKWTMLLPYATPTDSEVYEKTINDLAFSCASQMILVHVTVWEHMLPTPHRIFNKVISPSLFRTERNSLGPLFRTESCMKDSLQKEI